MKPRLNRAVAVAGTKDMRGASQRHTVASLVIRIIIKKRQIAVRGKCRAGAMVVAVTPERVMMNPNNELQKQRQ